MSVENPPIVKADDTFDRVNEYFYERGWTDGLPVVPPTVERVDAMLAGMPAHDADELIVIVGGGAGGKSMFLPTAGGQSLSVSRLIET